MSDQQVTLSTPAAPSSCRLCHATEGDVGDRRLEAAAPRTGYVTFDPGFVNTAVHDLGDHLHRRRRGHPALPRLPDRAAGARSRRFLEVSYLLIYGELPTADAARRRSTNRIRRHTLLHEDLKRFFDGFPRDAHPMPVLSSAVVGAVDLLPGQPRPVRPRRRSSCPPSGCWPSCRRSRPTRYKKCVGQPFLYPDNSLGLVENFLRMTFGFPAEPYEVDPALAKALDLLFILHADHEQNCSTSTVRLVGSAQANLFASVSAGINALSGPLHGGANEAVLEMLEQIRADGGDVDTFVSKVKNKEDGVRLMGFGHRVYKNYDPRAAIVKKTADEILDTLGVRRRAARHRHASSRRSRSPTTTSSSASSTPTSTSTPA